MGGRGILVIRDLNFPQQSTGGKVGVNICQVVEFKVTSQDQSLEDEFDRKNVLRQSFPRDLYEYALSCIQIKTNTRSDIMP